MGKHRFSIKQIAAQAGLSSATVDRVLNKRPGVRYYTEQRVFNAISELDAQVQATVVTGRRFYIDVVMMASSRYSTMVRDAMHDMLPSMQPFRICPRFHLFETTNIDVLRNTFEHAINYGTHGFIVKVPDNNHTRQIINNVYEQDFPIVTINADVLHCRRTGYVGMDNRAAGRTAAYLIGQWTHSKPDKLVISLSSTEFKNEEEREIGFRQITREKYPNLEIYEISGGYGTYEKTFKLMDEFLNKHKDIDVVYSIGGGNQGILDAFEKHGRTPKLFIGHDLDPENKRLLHEKKINAVIDYDRDIDIRRAYLYILQHHNQVTIDSPFTPSHARVVTPYNC